MKMKSFIKQGSPRVARANALITGVALLSPCALLAEEPEVTDAEAAANWIELSLGGVDVSGNDAAFQKRHGSNGDFMGGIKSFRFEQLTDDGTFLLEGHALFGLDDYKIDLRYDKDDIGFVRFGYKEFRTWYDGSGGYAGPGVAPPQDWFPIYDDELSLDRGEIWFEAGLRMPDTPEWTLGYRHLWRKGQKDSTRWGRYTRGNVPTYYDLDETQDIITLDFLHTMGKTDLGIGLSFQNIEYDNTRVASPGAGNPDPTRDHRVTNNEKYDTDIFNAHISTETHFNDRMMLSFGYSFTSLDTDFSGFRTTIDATGALRPDQNHAYSTMMGTADSTMSVLNSTFWWKPNDCLVIVPSIRAEFYEQDSLAAHLGGRRNRPLGLEDITDRSSDELTKLTEQIEARYTGIEDILIYGRAIFTQAESDLNRSSHVIESDNGIIDEIIDSTRVSDSDLDEQKYVVGANWYPCKGLTFAAQYYYRNREQDFDHVVTGDADAQLLQHNTETHDFNLRVSWKPLSNLTFVTRYDYQQTEIENQAWVGTIPVISGESTKHIFSESVTWSPTSWMYVQGSFHYIESETETDTDKQVGAQVLDWTNDYWIASLNAGFAIDDRTQLQVGYSYYDADNYVNNSAVGTPYGTQATDHSVTLRLTRQLSDSMTWNLGYGYFKGKDNAYAGLNDYEAHVVSTGLRMTF